MGHLSSPQRVVWEEGMFMSPHHFQQLDLYHEALLDTRLRAVLPYAWGVVSMEVDPEALRAGQVQLSRFAGVLPDGLPVTFERGQPELPAARLVEGHFPATQTVLDVYLGVPKERSHVESYGGTAARPGVNARFTPVKRPVSDLQAATSIIPIGFAQRNVTILFGTEPRDDYDAIKIAELARDKSGALVIVDGYIPPCLRADASPYLMDEVRKLLRLLLAKQRQLTARRRHRDASSLEFGPSDVKLYLELSMLNGVIPLLQHAQDAGSMSPLDLYLLLLRVAGQLCTVAVDADPAGLPAYQFTNLRATFSGLFARTYEFLRAVALEQCITVPLESGRDRMYRAKLDEPRLERCAQFLLAVRSELPEEQVAELLPRLSKVASGSEIAGLVQAATPGVPLQVSYRLPPEVPIQPGVVYFSLPLQDTYWRNAVRERNVALYLPHPFEHTQTSVELLAVPTAGQ